MFAGGRFDDAAGGFGFVVAPVGDPFLAENVFTKFIIGAQGVRTGILECVGARAEGDDGDTAFERLNEVPHVRLGPVAEAEGHDDGVGRIERLSMGNAGLVIGVDRAIGIDGEEHRTFEAVALAENFCEHRQAFLGAIFLVAREEDNVPAVGFSGRLEGDPILRGAGRAGEEQPDACKRGTDE